MDWDKEALEIVEAIPLPPMIAHFAKMDAERRARKKGEKRVTVETARETEHGYEQALGKEAVELMRRMARGEDSGLPDEFFVSEPEELYSIQLCPAQYGASTMEKREQMRRLLTPLRAKLKELGITRIIMDKAQTSLMSHHMLRIGLTGCPNACFSPYFQDMAILGVYHVGIQETGCVQCGKCVTYCTARAISLNEKGPVIDFKKCIKCSGCVEQCEEGVFYTKEKGYKVAIGGAGTRRPRIAQTVAEFTDLAGVLKILEKAITLLRDTPVEGRVISFREIVDRYGIEAFRI
jgi:Fe-S-cluster-containing hydrogenase component 2